MAVKFRDLETRLQRAEREVVLFQRISRLLARDSGPLQASLQQIVSMLVEFMACDSCLVYFIQHGELVLCSSNDAERPAIGKVRLAFNEGLTGWVAREKRLLAISREAFRDPRFKFFSDLPEDTYEAFLSAPILVRGQLVGVINVQHRLAHSHSGGEMELLATVAEQVGCLLLLTAGNIDPQRMNPVDLLLSSAVPAP